MSTVTRHVTYCRICTPLCGLVVDVDDEAGKVVRIVGDTDHPLTHGFTCPKGRRLGDFHSDPERLLETLRRRADGTFEAIEVGVAVEEIAAKLGAIIDADGPDAVGLFVGTQTLTQSLTHGFMSAWFRALGSTKRFGTMTIDQSAKTVAGGRLGSWAGGAQRFLDSDVWLLAGTNPLVSMQGGGLTGFPIHDGLRSLAAARSRGLQLIVVDPRRSEIAANADIHLQLRPGTDAALFAAIHHVLLRDGHVDAEFCERWVDGLDELSAAVAGATPEWAAGVTGLDAELIVRAATVFGSARSGMAKSGTGPDMGPFSNVAEHLIQALNVVCGRFPREGERPAGVGVLSGGRRGTAEAASPRRPWERSPKNRMGISWMPGELMSPILPAEILQDGPGRIRALIVEGGNPGAAFPDQDRILEALGELDLLVVVDPYLTETSRLAHYVIAPTLAFERPDDTRGYEGYFDEPFAQYTGPILPKPAGVTDDWEFFYDLAMAMGQTLVMGLRTYEPGSPKPTSEQLLADRAAKSPVPYERIKANPHGAIYPEVPPPVVAPASEGAAGRFEVMAPDVAEELAEAMAAGWQERPDRPFRLIVRRTKETMNTLGRRLPGLPRRPYNPCFVHPADLDRLGLAAGSMVELTSDHGSIYAVVEPDATLREGVLSMTHGFGGTPGLEDDPRLFGSNTTRLLSIDEGLQSINLMPLMNAIPVAMAPAPG